MSHMYWWLVRAMPRASEGNTPSRKVAKVPDQFAARCCLLNSLSERIRLVRCSSFSMARTGMFMVSLRVSIYYFSDAINHELVPVHYPRKACNEPSNGSMDLKLT